MKKSISILLVALLLALGLALPQAEPASASVPVCIDVNVSVDPDPVTAGDTVTFTFGMYNCGGVPLVIEDISCHLPVPNPFPILNPGEAFYWEVSHDTQPGDLGLMEVCCDVVIALLTGGEQGTFTICDWVDVLPQGNEVLVDIKPGSFPNSFNVKSKGVLPVAILSTADFDATQVDPATVALTYPLHASGRSPEVNPLRWNWEDVNEDGVTDLVFKFDIQELLILTMTREANGAEMVLQLIGNLMDGTPISGEDTVRIINK